jgi:adenosylcobinamide-GDP ribazoletransferase
MKFDGEIDRFLIYLKDISLCLARLSVLPAPREIDPDRPPVRSQWAYPVVGAFLGAVGGVAYAIALGLGLTPLLAAILALACLLCVTGAIHETALADLADRLAGLASRSNPTIYETSGGIGIAGTLTMILSLGARVGALAAIADAADVASAIVAALALSLAVMVAVNYSIPTDLEDEFSDSSDRPGTGVVLVAAVIAIVLSVLVLPFGAGAAIIGACLCGVGMAYAAWRQLDLESGELVAAAQPVTEIIVLLILAASAV